MQIYLGMMVWYLEDVLPEDATWLDTRTPGEYRRGHIEGFTNIPVDELRERLGELDKGKPIYVICQSGNTRSFLETIKNYPGVPLDAVESLLHNIQRKI